MIHKNYTLSYTDTTPVLYRCHVLNVGSRICANSDKSAANETVNTFLPSDPSAYRIILIKNGCGRILADGKWNGFGDGSLLLFRPEEDPEYECIPNGTSLEIYWLVLQIAPINVFDRIFHIPKANLFSVTDPEKLAVYFQHILDEAEASPAPPLLLSVLASAVLAKTADSVKPVLHGKSTTSKDTESYVQMIIDDITENYMLNTPIGEYASGVSMNKGYLIESFKKATGLTPLQFRIRLRMEKAQVMLAETTLPINEIASLLGYTDSLYFTKQFGNYAGMSPVAYRKKHQ
ncbi:MAG: helix-turn-helix transcriptional regulator [Clostridia bacterium]|nr:helix-turn-helix transcriptional regulator [Clostridia bacterium]